MVVHNIEDNKDKFGVTPSAIPVPVIATFSKDGKVVPLYFSVEGIRIKIDNIKWKQKRVDYMEFRCEIMLSDRVDEVRLKYYFKEQIWIMERK